MATRNSGRGKLLIKKAPQTTIKYVIGQGVTTFKV